MKLIHITDLHLMPPGGTLWGLDPFARLDAALNDIAAHHDRHAANCLRTGHPGRSQRGERRGYATCHTAHHLF